MLRILKSISDFRKAFSTILQRAKNRINFKIIITFPNLPRSYFPRLPSEVGAHYFTDFVVLSDYQALGQVCFHSQVFEERIESQKEGS